MTAPDALTALISRLREAMATAQGIASGPNGNGRMKVIVDGLEPGAEFLLHSILSSALSATDNSAPVEDGWRLVPVEPTEAMLEDTWRTEIEGLTWLDEVRAVWSDMLAAAPTPPTGSRGEG